MKQFFLQNFFSKKKEGKNDSIMSWSTKQKRMQMSEAKRRAVFFFLLTELIVLLRQKPLCLIGACTSDVNEFSFRHVPLKNTTPFGINQVKFDYRARIVQYNCNSFNFHFHAFKRYLRAHGDMAKLTTGWKLTRKLYFDDWITDCLMRRYDVHTLDVQNRLANASLWQDECKARKRCNRNQNLDILKVHRDTENYILNLQEFGFQVAFAP